MQFFFFSSLTSYYNHTHWMGILWYKVVHVTKLETLKTRCWDPAHSSCSQSMVPRPPQGHHNFTMTLRQMNTCLFNSYSFPSWSSSEASSFLISQQTTEANRIIQTPSIKSEIKELQKYKTAPLSSPNVF